MAIDEMQNIACSVSPILLASIKPRSSEFENMLINVNKKCLILS